MCFRKQRQSSKMVASKNKCLMPELTSVKTKPMKHNLTKGRMDDFFVLRMGKTPPRDNPTYWVNGTNEWVAISDMGKSKYIASSSECISDIGISDCNMQLVPVNTVIMSFKLSIGKIAITSKPLFTNEAIMSFIPKPNYFHEIMVDYIYYYLMGYRWGGTGKKAVMGVTLNKASLSATPFSFPKMEVQEQIVGELDKINELIDDCRELLRTLDNLAQSIFYDSFGDPISNPKGWEVKALKEVSQLINGRAYKQDELLDKGKYKVIRVGNFFTNTDYYYSDLELESDKYIDNGDLIFAWSASFGAFIWQGEKVIYHYHIWKVLYDTNVLNKEFYKYLLNEMTSSFMKDLHGIGMMHLTKSGMEQYMLPIPPLTLQEDFAKRIEAIEAIKATTQQQLAALQTLLDSRMDYWFN